MALDFLRDIGEVLSPVASIASTVVPFVTGTRAMRETRGPTQAEIAAAQALQQRQKLISALSDPEGTIFRNVEGDISRLQAQDFRRRLRDIANIQRRSAARGRVGFFDPERRDEAMSRLVTQFTQQRGPAARAEARGELARLINAYGGQAGAASGLIPIQQGRREQERADISLLGTGIAKALQDLSRTLSPQGQEISQLQASQQNLPTSAGFRVPFKPPSLQQQPIITRY